MVSLGQVGGGITEGVYTSWAAKWGWSLPEAPSTSYPPAFDIDEINAIFYLWWVEKASPYGNRFGSYNIADHSTIFESPIDIDYVYDAPHTAGYGDYTFLIGCHSGTAAILKSHQSYILLSRSAIKNIEVWKAGAKLWSRDITADTGEVGAQMLGTEISLTGKYIMFFEDVGQKLWLYEGT